MGAGTSSVAFAKVRNLPHNALQVFYIPITYNHFLSPRKLTGLRAGKRPPRSHQHPEDSRIPGRANSAPANPFPSARPTPGQSARGHVFAGGGEVGGSAAAILPAWRRSVRSAGRALLLPSPRSASHRPPCSSPLLAP